MSKDFMKLFDWLTVLALVSSVSSATAYDFRSSAAYQRLSPTERQRLEQVRHDQVLLWGALDMYADEHKGEVPSTLDELVPRYLRELPTDPFSTPSTANRAEPADYIRSKAGLGYLYRPGSPGNHAWIIASVGLPEFPYLAEKGNVGLYICKGTWISGKNPTTGRAFKAQSDPSGNRNVPAESKPNERSGAAGASH